MKTFALKATMLAIARRTIAFYFCSAIQVSLLPGAFTAILAGKNGGTGIGLVEMYNVH